MLQCLAFWCYVPSLTRLPCLAQCPFHPRPDCISFPAVPCFAAFLSFSSCQKDCSLLQSICIIYDKACRIIFRSVAVPCEHYSGGDQQSIYWEIRAHTGLYICMRFSS